MTVIVETGAGVRLANSYVDVAYVDNYLSVRGRSGEASWIRKTPEAKAEFVIAAADFIERRWGDRIRGTREFNFEAVSSTATVTFTGLPLAAETVVLGDQTYTFVSALTGAADEVLIGVDADATAANFSAAVNANVGGEGLTFGTGTEASRHAEAAVAAGVVTLTATADGVSGDGTVLTESLTNATATAFTGGKDGGSQPLSMPRKGLFDQSGRRVLGIPRWMKDAQAEYSVRAAAAALMPDPTVDSRGGLPQRVREKVGPIEEEVDYVPGSALSGRIQPYPAADRLILPYVTASGVIRH